MTPKYLMFAAVAFVLAACAQPEPEPVPVTLQPTYDKIGNASCPAGYIVAATESGATVCEPI